MNFTASGGTCEQDLVIVDPKPPVVCWCPSSWEVWSVWSSTVWSSSNCADSRIPQALHIKSWHRPEIMFIIHGYEMNSGGDIDNWIFNFCNKRVSLQVMFGMEINLVSLIKVQGLRLYKRHFAFPFSKYIFVLKSPRNMLLQGHAVQEEPCQHQPLQGVAKRQHRSYGRTFCLV